MPKQPVSPTLKRMTAANQRMKMRSPIIQHDYPHPTAMILRMRLRCRLLCLRSVGVSTRFFEGSVFMILLSERCLSY